MLLGLAGPPSLLGGVQWAEWKWPHSCCSAVQVAVISRSCCLRSLLQVRLSKLLLLGWSWESDSRAPPHTNSMENAIATHAVATQGLSLSPTRANFQKMPLNLYFRQFATV
jgi:hypothetical protein